MRSPQTRGSSSVESDDGTININPPATAAFPVELETTIAKIVSATQFHVYLPQVNTCLA